MKVWASTSRIHMWHMCMSPPYGGRHTHVPHVNSGCTRPDLHFDMSHAKVPSYFGFGGSPPYGGRHTHVPHVNSGCTRPDLHFDMSYAKVPSYFGFGGSPP